VYVLRDGPPRAVPVTVGLSDGDVTEVVAGDLREGDVVITGEEATSATAARATGGLAGLFRPPGGPRSGRPAR
jgi:HlyD family secretion protein